MISIFTTLNFTCLRWPYFWVILSYFLYISRAIARRFRVRGPYFPPLLAYFSLILLLFRSFSVFLGVIFSHLSVDCM